MVDIFVPTHRGLRIPAKQVLPNPGELILDCACGSRGFGVFVRPGEQGAKVTTLICEGCKRCFYLDGNSILQADGKVNIKGTADGNH